ncbi:VOC family protein [Cytophaga aurantiaca]|uniref:VOC family protein n=1 Tax=Cytophaga aurantiaca TaxID=29530 RepID=UPI0003767DE2|nr:VOC family protein [Cytophaga aurantiaca]
MNLNQITFPVLDVERSIVFYKTLGFKLIVEALPEYARFECDEGSSTFSLHKVDVLSTGEGIWIYFESADLDKRVAELQTKNITFEELPNDKPWLWREARLKDPDGNQLILYKAGENRLNPPWRIKD